MPKCDFHVDAKDYFQNQGLDPRPRPLETWALKNMDPEK